MIDKLVATVQTVDWTRIQHFCDETGVVHY